MGRENIFTSRPGADSGNEEKVEFSSPLFAPRSLLRIPTSPEMKIDTRLQKVFFFDKVPS